MQIVSNPSYRLTQAPERFSACLSSVVLGAMLGGCCLASPIRITVINQGDKKSHKPEAGKSDSSEAVDEFIKQVSEDKKVNKPKD